MIVLDASAAVELVLRLPLGGKVAQRLADPDEAVHAPHLLGVEVAQVVRRYVHRGELGAQRAVEALGDFADLDVVRHPHEPLLLRMWHLRDNLTAYDATYVALAEALDAPLLTLDAGLANAPGHDARVELVA
ncbi:MAG: type II toxin-antitoxin system VapC family toxin [Actinobacteria bacterium]|nr:type II toxin-antitoxin system VapC family toxin [Actinomycetota bacterium]